MQKSFPLFNLPYVVLSKTIRMLNPTELTYLALSTRKSYKIVKFLKIKNPNMSIGISCSKYADVIVETEKMEKFLVFEVLRENELDYSDPRIRYLNFGNSVIPVMKSYPANLTVFWGSDTFLAVQKLSEFVSELFEIPIRKLCLSNENRKNDPRRIIDWLRSRDETLKSCYFECYNTNGTELEYFLDNLKITTNFHMKVETTKGFRYNFKNPLEIDIVDIAASKWLTIANLNQLNSRELEMPGTKFTNLEVNRFLRNWIGGLNSRLQYLSVGTELINIDQIIDGINVRRRAHFSTMRYFYRNNRSISFQYSINIVNNAGKVASILYDDRQTHVDNEFIMVVWPDWKGRQSPIRAFN
ncbi:unnamed protein product [Caenorhabditis brenneri]